MMAAMTNNRVIGRNNDLPWHMPADLKKLKEVTMGHYVIMGRKTYDSVGGKPLPGRTNIVITRQKDFKVSEKWLKASSVAEALSLVKDDPEPFILGGAQIYKEAMDIANRIYLTVIDTEVQGDAFFPEIDERIFKLKDVEKHSADEKHKFNYEFRLYERISSS